VYATESKSDAGEPIGLTMLASIAGTVALPVVAIGGIDASNAAAVRAAGAAGIAVIRAVMAAEEPEERVRELLRAMAEAGAE
jgi:thiamine-phosphate diphosphorylase